MSDATLFLVGVGATLVLSFAVVFYLRRPLDTILGELCGTAERARFWAAFSAVSLVLVPLIFALHYQPDPYQQAAAVFEIAAQVKWALAGLATTVLIVAVVISRFIPPGRPPAPAPAPPQQMHP